jgi:hypothetical protein
MENKKSMVPKILLQHHAKEKISTTIIHENEIKLYKAAVAYVQVLDWSVFPLHSIHNGQCTCGKKECKNIGKHPRTINGLKDATTDTSIIKKWWNQWSNSNIGIPTGQINGFIAVDIDPRHGGNESLDELISIYGELPETVVAITGGGGRHILFKHPKRLVGNKTGILPGIDIKGDGGYIIVSPSNHHTGGTYEWELSSRPTKVQLAEIPEWLMNMIVEPNKGEKKPTNYWMKIIQGVDDGQRNMTTASFVGYLLRHGIAAPIAFELTLLWNERNNPPQPRKVIETTFNSILRAETNRLKEPRPWH